MWNDTQREIMLRSGQSEKRREETARRTQRRRRRRQRIDLRARARRRGCCDKCEGDVRGGEEKERANDRTARLSPLKQFVSAVHRNWSGNTAATVSNTLRPCVLSRIPYSSLSVPLSTDSTTFVSNHYYRTLRFRSDRTDTCGTSSKILTITCRGWSPGILALDGISRL